jgi:hypothetical protein
MSSTRNRTTSLTRSPPEYANSSSARCLGFLGALSSRITSGRLRTCGSFRSALGRGTRASARGDVEDLPVQKLDGADRLVEVRPGDALPFHQVEQVAPDVLVACALRGQVDMRQESADMTRVHLDGTRTVAAKS